MAANCARAGCNVTVWNRNRETAETFASDLGAVVASTPAGLAGRCDVVLSMLADDAAAMEVHGGAGGTIVSAGAKTIVEMGTISPGLVRKLARLATEQGKRFVDAPVSGATDAARDAGLLIMAGARDGEFPDLETVFAAIGKKTVWLGAVGDGAVMKLVVNMLIHGINQTLAEALTLAGRAGINEELAFDVIENSAAAAPMLKYRRPLYLDEASHAVTFTVNLAAKDLGLALDQARELEVAMPQARANFEVLSEAIGALYGNRDMASIFNFMKEKSK